MLHINTSSRYSLFSEAKRVTINRYLNWLRLMEDARPIWLTSQWHTDCQSVSLVALMHANLAESWHVVSHPASKSPSIWIRYQGWADCFLCAEKSFYATNIGIFHSTVIVRFSVLPMYSSLHFYLTKIDTRWRVFRIVQKTAEMIITLLYYNVYIYIYVYIKIFILYLMS